MPANVCTAIIFDMDGVMIDSEPFYWNAEREMAARHGACAEDRTLRRMMGREAIDSMRIFAADCAITDATPEQLVTEREQVIAALFASRLEPMPGLREMLVRFRGRCRMAVATSSSRRLATIALSRLGIETFFEVVRTADETVHGKPDPEIYRETLASLRVPPRACVILEDSRAGALAAHRSGAYVIAVPSSYTAVDDFSFAEFRASNLFEAADHVEHLLSAASVADQG
jgi:HAD superfamily hydrolase (TIGR01509 family)